jgi:hypothetical protein
LKPVLGKKLRPYLKKNKTKAKKAMDVVQVFKPQYHQKKKKKDHTQVISYSVYLPVLADFA